LFGGSELLRNFIYFRAHRAGGRGDVDPTQSRVILPDLLLRGLEELDQTVQLRVALRRMGIAIERQRSLDLREG
jgi:hypothetical protein